MQTHVCFASTSTRGKKSPLPNISTAGYILIDHLRGLVFVFFSFFLKQKGRRIKKGRGYVNISKKNKNQRYEREFKVYNDMFWIVYHIYKRPHNFRKILIVCSTYIMSHSSKVSWGYRVSQTYIWKLLSDFTKKEKGQIYSHIFQWAHSA